MLHLHTVGALTMVGVDWIDVETNCHQPCPSGNNLECESPDHSCWAYVHSCKARTAAPTAKPVATRSPTKRPTRAPTGVLAPAEEDPARDPDAPTTPQPTDRPTDLHALLEGQKDRFYCAATWDGIVCGVSNSCPSGDSR